MPVIRFEPTRRINEQSAWLRGHQRSVKSQFGQDGVIEKIFEIIGAENKSCVEFGAWDGVHLSNTWNLVQNLDWRALLIEGDASKCSQIVANHGHSDRVTAVNAYVGWEGDQSLEHILRAAAWPETFDFLSIDIDGNDWHVWRSLTAYRPRVVCIEFNPAIGNEVFFVQDPEPGLQQGASLRAMVGLAKEKGYSLVSTCTSDVFFVADELYGRLGIEDNDIDAIHDGSLYETKLIQCYDGALYTAGNRRLLWNSVEFEADELQLMPRSLRKFR